MDSAWRMSAEDAEEYTQSLGQIMSGGWRQIALAQRLGVPEALGMTTQAWVQARLGGYVRQGLEERRRSVKELTDPEGEFQLSQRQAAEVLGIDHSTVSRDLRGGADAPPDGAGIGGAGEPVGAGAPPDGWAEPSVEPGLDDIDWEPSSPPPEETAYYALSRQRLVVRLAPDAVAEAAPDAESALAGFEEYERWLGDFVRALRERVAAPVRAIK